MNLGVSSVCITNKVPLRMVKKYVFICSKRDKCLYRCIKHMCAWIMQVKVISHCKRRPPPAFSTVLRGKRSTSTKEREMVSFMHFFPKEQLVDVNFLYRETHRSRESWDREQPWYRTASRSPALFCLCNQSIYWQYAYFSIGTKEVCPPSCCVVKRERVGTLCVQCDGCLQWYHARCIGFSRKQLARLDTFFFVNVVTRNILVQGLPEVDIHVASSVWMIQHF